MLLLFNRLPPPTDLTFPYDLESRVTQFTRVVMLLLILIGITTCYYSGWLEVNPSDQLM